jgi:outer membrane lipoprotein-sorting protein
MVLAAVAPVFAGGCPRIKDTTVVPPGRTRPAMEATADDLIARYNEQARAVRTLRASVTMKTTAGATYNGVMVEEKYHEVNGFILAQKPSHIRVIGQAPVLAKNIFDMVSDGETFRIFIPSKNKFITGPAALERPSKKAIENLRPQHVLDAMFWPEIATDQSVLFEEFNADPDRYYVLTVLRTIRTGDNARLPIEVARKIWFDRADLSVARVQIYVSGGRVATDIRYSDWLPLADVRYPRHIVLQRPQDDYKLEIHVTQLALNEDIAAERFKLEQPAGTELVKVGEGNEAKQP